MSNTNLQGLLYPGQNITFCGEPSRPSVWRRILRRPKSDDINGSCEAMSLTMSKSGLVVLRKLPNMDSNSSQMGKRSGAQSVVKLLSVYTSRRQNNMWKGNYFPLWKRILKRWKPLPIPILAYEFLESNLTIWRTIGGNVTTQDISVVGQSREIPQSIKRYGKIWKVFIVRSILLAQ